MAAARRGRVARQGLEAGYARMDKAYKSVWGFWELESICLAIRAWRGAGQCDDLVPHHLYSHMAKPRPGPKLPSCKGMPPAVLELKEP